MTNLVWTPLCLQVAMFYIYTWSQVETPSPSLHQQVGLILKQVKDFIPFCSLGYVRQVVTFICVFHCFSLLQSSVLCSSLLNCQSHNINNVENVKSIQWGSIVSGHDINKSAVNILDLAFLWIKRFVWSLLLSFGELYTLSNISSCSCSRKEGVSFHIKTQHTSVIPAQHNKVRGVFLLGAGPHRRTCLHRGRKNSSHTHTHTTLTSWVTSDYDRLRTEPVQEILSSLQVMGLTFNLLWWRI